MKKGKLAMVVGTLAVVFCAVLALILSSYISKSSGDSRARAEYEHGVRLPPSAAEIQCRGDGWLRVTPIGGGFVHSMFEMDTAEIPAFLAPLHIRSRTAPALSSGDPKVNGWNVWPQGSLTFIVGNPQGGGDWRHTWSGTATPMEMVSCDSPEGIFLHLEFWKLESGRMLIKMGTMFDD